MKDCYRDLDYSEYVKDEYGYVYVKNGEQKNYFHGHPYGSYGLAFYFYKFELGIEKAFPTKAVVTSLKASCSDKFMAGHIINSELDGTRKIENLVPLTYSANANHKTVEGRLKRMIGNLNRLGDDYDFFSNFALGYEVVVNVDEIGFPLGIQTEIDVFYLGMYNSLVRCKDSRVTAEFLASITGVTRFPYKAEILNIIE